MGNNIFDIIINGIRMRFMPLLNRLRMIFSPTYFRTNVLAVIRNFFSKLFNVKPRNKDDYYEIFGWLVSKRLAFAVVVVIGVVSLFFLINMRSVLFPSSEVNNIKTYHYNSFLLKFAKGKVRITGQSGYLAYEGEVSDGFCSGQGTLFSPSKRVVYQGSFDKSMYEGAGQAYYPEGSLKYNGGFHENLYSGTGKLYRESGSMEYEGEFSLGMKEGAGVLYDTGQNPLFTGQFTQNDIRYSALLGKRPEEVATAYTGETVMYHSADERIRLMEDIRAMTLEQNDADSVDNEQYHVGAVFVLRNYIRHGGTSYGTFSELEEVFGEPIYSGRSRATLGEVIAINYLNGIADGQVVYGYADLQTDRMFTEYEEVQSYDTEYELFLHSYRLDSLIYTFVGREGTDTFDFYYVIGDSSEDLTA